MKKRDIVLLIVLLVIGVVGVICILYNQSFFSKVSSNDFSNSKYISTKKQFYNDDNEREIVLVDDSEDCRNDDGLNMMSEFKLSNYNDNHSRNGRGIMGRKNNYESGRGMMNNSMRFDVSNDDFDDIEFEIMHNNSNNYDVEVLVLKESNNRNGIVVNEEKYYDIETNDNILALVVVNDSNENIEISFDKNVYNEVLLIDGDIVSNKDVDNGVTLLPNQEYVIVVYLEDGSDVSLLVDEMELVEIRER